MKRDGETFENMSEGCCEYEPDAECIGEMSSDDDSDDGETHLLKLNQKVMKYALFYSFVTVIKILKA